MAGIQELADATLEFYELTVQPSFSKSLALNEAGERRLLPLFGAFLCGRFGKVEREISAKLRKGFGRIDFRVGETAVELAVRRPKDGKSKLSSSVNRDEIEKLLRHTDGMSALVLLDYSRIPFKEADILIFRHWPSLGKGNYKISPFNVIYCYRENGVATVEKHNIRI